MAKGLIFGYITAWLGMIGMMVCIAMGHDGALVSSVSAINIAALGAVGIKIVTTKTTGE